MGLFEKKGKKEEVTPSVEPVATTETVVATSEQAVPQSETPAVQAEVSMDNNPFVEEPAPVEEVVETPTPEVSFDKVFNASPSDLVETPTETTLNATEVAVPVMEETAATIEAPQPLPEASLNVNPEAMVGEVTKEDEITQIVSASVDAQDTMQEALAPTTEPVSTPETIPAQSSVQEQAPTPEQAPATEIPTPAENIEVASTPQVADQPTTKSEAQVGQPAAASPTETIEEFSDISSTEIVLPNEVQESQAQAETEQLLMEEQPTPTEETIELNSEPLTTPTVEPSFVVPQNSIMASNSEEESIISVPPLKTAVATPASEEITLPEPAVVSEEVHEETLPEAANPTPVEAVVETPASETIELSPTPPTEENTAILEVEATPVNQVSSTEQAPQPEVQVEQTVTTETPTVESIPTPSPQPAVAPTPEAPAELSLETPVVGENPIPAENPVTANNSEVTAEPTATQVPSPEELPKETPTNEPVPVETPTAIEASSSAEPVVPDGTLAAETITEQAPIESPSESVPEEPSTIVEESVPEVNTPHVINGENSESVPSTPETSPTSEESTNNPVIEEDETVILPIINENVEIPEAQEEPVSTEESVVSEEPVTSEEPTPTEEPVTQEESSVEESSPEETIKIEQENRTPSGEAKEELSSSHNIQDKVSKEPNPKINQPQPTKPSKTLEKPQLTERDGIVTYISDPTPTRFCNNCGIMLTDDSSICPSCGEPID